MSEARWNREQLAAIEHRGSTLLVAAAAGSGKTTVLVERLLRRITDPANPVDIDRFLVVTFTRAAAQEMRGKIARAITQAIARNPGSRHLRRQLSRLGRARITTIHSFCTALIREHFQQAGVSPDFRVADADECGVLRLRILDDLLEERYEDASGENKPFFALVDALSASRDDQRLVDVILECYDKLMAHPDPEAWSERMQTFAAELVAAEPMQTPYGQELCEQLGELCSELLIQYEESLELIADNPEFARYADLFAAEHRDICTLLQVIDGGNWDAVVQALDAVVMDRLPGLRGVDAELKKRIVLPRDLWKKEREKYTKRWFAVTSETIHEDSAAVLPVAQALLGLVRELYERYAQAKKKRRILDFNDLEQTALRLLTVSDGEGGLAPSELARAIGEELCEILVDEYQDTNGVQDALFASLSRNNLFMVGDMKQSIYRFRLADPLIFLEKYNTYPDYDTPDLPEDAPRRIILSRNYRSRPEVLDAVNGLFAKTMSPQMGELAYTEREYLNPGATYPDAEADHHTELCVLSGSDVRADDPDAEEEKLLMLEARYVAARIRQMHDEHYPVSEGDHTRPARWGDFAVLLRSFSGKAALFEQALAEAGIPSYSEASASLLDVPEVDAVLQLLYCIDNPRQDVALASVMRMPMYAFSAEELAAIRLRDRKIPYYEAVFLAADSTQEDVDTQPDAAVYVRASQKARRLMDQLSALRQEASNMPLGRFLWHVYTVTGLLTAYGAMKDGERRQQNLLALLEHARRFEQAGYRGLYRFVNLLRRMQEGRSGAAVPHTGGGDAVQIVSIHKSMGLEYPIVFVSGCACLFNEEDTRQAVLLHPKLGVGLKRREVERRIEYPTLAYNAIAARIRREQRSEELRVLYVAMTRAREKLIMTASVKDAYKYFEGLCADAHLCTPRALRADRNMLGWMAAALLDMPAMRMELASLYQLTPASPGETENHSWRFQIIDEQYAAAQAEEEAPVPEETRAGAQWLDEILAWRYPHPAAVELPSKLTATELKGRASDSELQENAQNLLEKPAKRHIRPHFITQQGLTAAERGTALHLAMQFADPAHCGSLRQVSEEIERLKNQQYLTAEQAEAVQPGRILRFWQSELGIRIRRASEVFRECKFSLLAPAKRFREDADEEDEILLQGVIDCYFKETDEQGRESLVVVDYKTDFVPDEGGARIMLERYRGQMEVYRYALEEMTGIPVKALYLYLFKTGEAVEVQES
ncbi:MAG: helicase-exonuclease AddAB subunit AddA [Clostridia bacterium]|nr:helicase-exonuclease AddAB subunit AddA [Clostridia bacterium]